MSTRSIFTLAGSGLAMICTTSALAGGGGPMNFSNPAAISIPDGPTGQASSTITVTGVAEDIVGDVNVTITGLLHTWASDVDLLLVGPGGQKVLLMSDMGGSVAFDASKNYTFDDEAPGVMPGPCGNTTTPVIPSGSYKPTNCADEPFGGDDVFNAPAPAGPYSLLLSAFDNLTGAAVDGTWTLYAGDDAAADTGSISGGWGLGFNVVNNNCAEPLTAACPGDFNADGIRDVNDLLTLIGVFGQTGPPRPIADIAPLPNGDCTVDVNDLLPLVGGWGNCPPTNGACCLPNGSCLASQTTAQCSTAGGTFQGFGVACGAVSCPLLGNECSTAISVQPGIIVIDMTNYTLGASPPGSCGIWAKDAWLKFVVPQNGFIYADTEGNPPPVDDTVVQFFRGTCASLVNIECDDDDGTGFLSVIQDKPVTAGETIYIRVGTWSGEPNGNVALRFLFKDNDFCVAADTLVFGTPVVASLGNATGDSGPPCEFVEYGAGRWYKFIGNGNTVNVSTCATDPKDNVYFQTVTVLCGSSCGPTPASDFRCVKGGDYDDVCNPFESFDLCTRNGKTYYVLVHSTDLFDSEGNYELVVTNSGTSCPATTAAMCPIPLTNDTCATATVITPPAPLGTVVLEYDNTNATQDGPTNTCDVQGKNVWFKITPPANGNYDFILGDAGAGSMDSLMAIYSSPGAGTCATLTQVACNDDGVAPGGFSQVVNLPLTTANTYFISVGTWNNVAGGIAQMSVHRD